MHTIHKYQLAITDKQLVDIPRGGKVLSAQIQRDTLCIWALVDDAAPVEPRTFYVHGTGHKLLDPTARFIGTVQMRGGALIFHVFEKE